MRRLGLIVHGSHRFSGELTDEADLRIQVLASQLRQPLNGHGQDGNVVIISATPVQDAKTAGTLLSLLSTDRNVAWSTSDVLWSDPHRPADMTAIKQLIQDWRETVACLLLVVHPEVAEVVQVLCEKELQQHWDVKRLRHGQCLVFDIPKRRRFEFLG